MIKYMNSVVIVGGGAAGLMAAYSASKEGKNVILLERNEKLGKKIYITGKGRCNLTNDVLPNEFFPNVVSNNKFLFGCINTFSPKDLIELFNKLGLELKTERGNRVFPLSDKASDVTKTLEKALVNNGVDIRLNCKVNSIVFDGDKVCGVQTDVGIINADSVIICTGGISYPLTGSDGDGYKFAKNSGHNLVDLRPALVGIELKGEDYKQVQGLPLKNVSLTAKMGEKVLYSEFGEMLFTHFGISGPIVLSCSSIINRKDLQNVNVFIDLKPALSEEVLDKRLIKEFKENNLKDLSTAMRTLMPKNLIDIVARQARVSLSKKCAEITAEERQRLLFSIKNLMFSVKKLRPIEEAIVTAGGVDVKQINPKTMESKLVKNLYFAGEVLDVDAFTGGFNLQIAFSTGYVAGLYC